MKTKRIPLTGAKTPVALNLLQRGMPALDSVHSVVKLKGKWNILRTTEVDSYEETPALQKALAGPRPALAALAAAMKTTAPASDDFTGTARKAAKLSIAQAPIKTSNDLSALIASLAPEDKMIQHNPKITTAATSDRVSEEKRNVRVAAFLYAASRETDNDFHLIIGRDPSKSPEMYMTMELSGLPPATSPAFATLDAARTDYKKFFGKNLPGLTYHFYSPPIPVTIEGSLFFDMSHASGTRPGPPSLKSRMPTIFEVHPITSIKLGP
jgi:hypothetical protein